MYQGDIKTINAKGFGFITREGQKDLFFHASQLRGVNIDSLRAGDKVEFGIADGEKGPYATEVQLVN